MVADSQVELLVPVQVSLEGTGMSAQGGEVNAGASLEDIEGAEWEQGLVPALGNVFKNTTAMGLALRNFGPQGVLHLCIGDNIRLRIASTDYLDLWFRLPNVVNIQIGGPLLR